MNHSIRMGSSTEGTSTEIRSSTGERNNIPQAHVLESEAKADRAREEEVRQRQRDTVMAQEFHREKKPNKRGEGRSRSNDGKSILDALRVR
jgi:hypothetical protein